MLASCFPAGCIFVGYPFVAVLASRRDFFCLSGCIADCTFFMLASCFSAGCLFVGYPFVAVLAGCRNCLCISFFMADFTFLMLVSCGSAGCLSICHPFKAVLSGCYNYFCFFLLTAFSCTGSFFASCFSAGCFFCNCPIAPLMSEGRQRSYSFFLVFMCFTFLYEFSGFFTSCFCAFNNFPHTVT